MSRRLLGHVRQNAVAYLALFVALGGTTAYAANTINSSDIVDGQVTTADVRDDNLVFGGLYSPDLGDGSVRSSEVLDDSLTNVDIKNFTLGNGDFLDGSVNSRVITDDSLTSADVKDGSITNADLAGPADATPFIGRGHLTCNPNCFAFNFRPQGFTENNEPGPLENRPFRAPPGGLRVSDWAATLTTTVPAGQAFNMWLIQFSTSNVYLTCSIAPGASSCSSSGTATIPAGDLFWVVINTSYSVANTPYLDFSFRARPAS